VDTAGGVILCRVSEWGKTSLAMTIDPQLRKAFGLVHKDVLGFRIVTVQGRVLGVVEKIQLGRVALIAKLPVDVLPSER
jgi:hypothetical protein